MSLYHNSNLAMKKEIAWILGNLITKGSRDQIVYIVEYGAIEILLDYLENMNVYKFQILDWLQNLVNLIDPQNQDIITKKCQLLKRKDFNLFFICISFFNFLIYNIFIFKLPK